MYSYSEYETLNRRFQEALNEKSKYYDIIVKNDVQRKLLKEEIGNLEKSNEDLKRQISDMKSEPELKECDCKSNTLLMFSLQEKNAELMKKISDLEKRFAKERNGISSEKEKLELTNIKLSKQVSDFEKVIILEKEKFEKENKSLSKIIVDLETSLEKERKEFDSERREFEKMKVEGFQSKCLKEDFEREKKYFKDEIRKLTKKLSDLALECMNEKNDKSTIQKRFDLFVKKNNVLEVNSFDVGSSGQNSPDTIDQSPINGSADFECSFKTTSSSTVKNIPLQVVRQSVISSKDKIRPSNLFYDRSVDRSDNKSFKNVKKIWVVKGANSEKTVPKSSVHYVKKNDRVSYAKPFVKPDLVYSINQLIRLSKQKLCCSYCGKDDFVNRNYANYWYGTYRVPVYPNKPGPKFKWVPKSV